MGRALVGRVDQGSVAVVGEHERLPARQLPVDVLALREPEPGRARAGGHRRRDCAGGGEHRRPSREGNESAFHLDDPL